jgi:hypothetical protein
MMHEAVPEARWLVGRALGYITRDQDLEWVRRAVEFYEGLPAKYEEPGAKIGLRVALPQGIRVHTDSDFHLDGGSCLYFGYRPFTEVPLIHALERAIYAIRMGPR